MVSRYNGKATSTTGQCPTNWSSYNAALRRRGSMLI